MRYRVAIRFSVTGDIRFISHHDTMRLLERAIARSGLPVRFSEGFNPRPRLSLPLPRAVGVATRADVLVIELTAPVEPDALLARLSAQMPGGLRLLTAETLAGSGSLQPLTARYELRLGAERIMQAGRGIVSLLSAPRWMVMRDSGKGQPAEGIDLRPLLVDAHADQDAVHWTIRVTNAGSIRPVEFLDSIGLNGRELLHRVERIHVEWSQSRSNDLEPVAAAEIVEA